MSQHQVKKTTLGKDTQHRQAFLRNGLRNLITHGQIKTTKAKAKELKRWADKLIYRAQTDTPASRRQLHRFFGKRDIVNTLVERIAPLFKKRHSGFTRIKPYGIRRGDNTKLVVLELIKKPEVLGTLKNPNQKKRK